jgi:transposase
MISVPETLPDYPILLKQRLLSLHEQVSEKNGQIERLREQNALLIQRLFGRKSEQTVDPDSPQLAMFNEAKSLAEPAPEVIEEEVVTPLKRRGKRKPLPAELPRVEVVHELPEHQLS